MSDKVVYTCVYGRHKPYKVHKEFQGDGKIFLKGREMVLVCDDSKDEIGRAVIPPHKDITIGKEYVIGSYEIQLGEVYDGHAEQPPAPEPVKQKLKPFKAPTVSLSGGDHRSHPYGGGSPAGSRFVRRGGHQSAAADGEDSGSDAGDDRKPLFVRNNLTTAAALAAPSKPVPKKTKYNFF